MAHFAQVINNMVVNVIVAEQDFIDAQPNFYQYIKTSYNTHGGVHSLGGTPLRKNYAGIGYTYNEALDGFIAPKPYPSFILNETTCLYEVPVAYPNDGLNYTWDESVVNWVLVA